MLNPFDLTGRRAVVTGGSGGIGQGLVRGLAEAGARTVVVSRGEGAERVAAELRGAGHDSTAVTADLEDRVDLERGFGAAVDALGGSDVLVTCHGTNRAGEVLDVTLDDWDHVLEVNLTAVFRLAQLAGSAMAGQGRGKIVTIASMLSFGGGFRAAPYAASKGGV